MMQAVALPPASAEAPPTQSKYSGLMPKLYTSMASKDRSYYVKLRKEDDDPGFAKRKKKRSSIRIGSRLRRKAPGSRFGVPKMRFRLRRPRIKLGFLASILSPLRLLKRLRDAYVNMMLSLAERGDFSGAVMGNAVYIPTGQPFRARASEIDARKEDEILAYIDFLRRSGRLASDPVMDR